MGQGIASVPPFSEAAAVQHPCICCEESISSAPNYSLLRTACHAFCTRRVDDFSPSNDVLRRELRLRRSHRRLPPAPAREHRRGTRRASRNCEHVRSRVLFTIYPTARSPHHALLARWLKRGEGQVSSTHPILSAQQSLWSKGSAYPPAGSDTLRYPFQFQLPESLLPSFHYRGLGKRASVLYSVTAKIGRAHV